MSEVDQPAFDQPAFDQPAFVRSAVEGPAVDQPHDADVPRPPRFLRVALRVFEIGCWTAAGILAIVFVTAVVMLFIGTVPVTARLIDGASLIENSGGVVEGGTIDVVLENVPLSVSWPYFLTLLVTMGAWAVLCVSLSRISRGLRWGVPFRSVTPRFLYTFATVWTVVSVAWPFVVGATQPAMAQAAGVAIPGATFAYTMAAEDLLGILIGPVIVVVVAVLATGSRMWAEHRTLV